MKQLVQSGRNIIMNGQKTKYEKYLESLELMKEPVVPRAKLNMRGAILFAKEKGVPVESLTQSKKNQFIQYLA